MAYDRLPTLLDDHAARLFNQETVALAHLAAGPTHIIKTGRIILSRRWHEGALQLRRLRSGRWRRRLKRGWRHGGLSDRLLRRNRTRRLDRRAAGTALTLLLLRNWQGLRTL